MKTPLIYLLAAVTLFGTGCENSGSDTPDTPLRPIALSTKGAEINRSTQQFSLRFFREIAKNKEVNFCISPLSASLCMGMLLNGADGETYDEMQQTLGYAGYTREEINEYARTMQAELPTLDAKTLFSTANSLWFREGFPILPEFVETNREYYQAEVRTVPFTPDLVSQINRWCSDHTAGRIPKIIDELPESSVAVEMNALYFKGIWATEFKKEQTTDENFYPTDGSTLSVPSMHQTETLAYYADNEARIVELPYGNGAFSMLLFCPADPARTTIDALLDGLTEEKWDQWTGGLFPHRVTLTLPRFKMEYEKELNREFQEMGTRQVFDILTANLSKLSPEPMALGLLKQKTFIEVDEKGTEAAAVTIGIDYTSSYEPVGPPIDLRFDHPFGFVIREKSTEAIIFAGKVGKPI